MSKHKPIEIPVANRKHLARAQREQLLTRWIMIGTAATLLVVFGLLGWGLFQMLVLEPREPVAKVGQVEISTLEFQKAAKYQRVMLVNQYSYLQSLAQFFGENASISGQIQQVEYQLTYPIALGTSVLDSLVKDEIVRQEAARRGITVSEAEVTEAIQASFDFYPDGTPTPTITPTALPTDPVTPTATLSATDVAATDTAPTATLPPTSTPDPSVVPTETPTAGPSPTPPPTSTPFPTPTPLTADGYQTLYRQRLDTLKQLTGMSEADMRRVYETQLLYQKLRDVISADVSDTQEQVRARHILVAEVDLAKEIIAKLKQGADFLDLAKQYSTDSSNKDSGGDLGWFARGEMVAAFEDAAFGAPVGVIAEPVQSEFGWHVIEVLGHEDRPLSAQEVDQAKAKAFSDWLDAQRNDAELVTTFEYWVERVPEEPTVEEILQSQEEAQS